MDYKAYTYEHLELEYGDRYFLHTVKLYLWRMRMYQTEENLSAQHRESNHEIRILFLTDEIRDRLDFKLVWATQDVKIYRHKNLVGLITTKLGMEISNRPHPIIPLQIDP